MLQLWGDIKFQRICLPKQIKPKNVARHELLFKNKKFKLSRGQVTWLTSGCCSALCVTREFVYMEVRLGFYKLNDHLLLGNVYFLESKILGMAFIPPNHRAKVLS